MQILANFLASAFGKILGKFVGLAAFQIALATAFFVGLWLFGQDMLMYILEQIMQLISYVLQSVNIIDQDININYYFNLLPDFVIHILQYCHAGKWFTLIAGAYAVRITLRLTPFIRSAFMN